MKYINYVVLWKKYFLYRDEQDNNIWYYFMKTRKNIFKINKSFKQIIRNTRKNNLDFTPSITKTISKDLSVTPFWNNDVKNISDKLFLPINDNMIKIDNQMNTWFNSEFYKKTCKNNYKLIVHNESVSWNEKILSSKQIQLFPNKEQKEAFSIIFGIYRYYYNITISFINNMNFKERKTWIYSDYKNKIKEHFIIPENKKNLISLPTIRFMFKNFSPKWLEPKMMPVHIRDQAIAEAVNAYNNCMKTYKKYGNVFNLGYKKKFNNTHTIKIPPEYFSKKRNSILVNYKYNGKFIFRKMRKNGSLKFVSKITTLTYHKCLKRWFLNAPIDINKKKCYQKKSVASIDPGEANFMTIYDEDGVAILGKGTKDKLYKLCKETDIIISNKEKTTKKRSLKRALHRKLKKIKDYKKELHWKTINYLCKTFKKILIPSLQIKKLSSLLKSKIARRLYTLSHYEFIQKLKYKCSRYGISYESVGEAYTSKTCTKCGKLKKVMGRVYECDSCGLVIDRDMNGARNILLRNLKKL